MKTAISLPDVLFHEADLLASRMHVNRSQLYAMALAKFVKEHQQGDITKRVNEHIEKYGQLTDKVFLDANHRDMRKVEW